MSYRAIIAASITQFGETLIDFNLDDDERVRASLRKSRTFSGKPTEEEIAQVKDDLIETAEAEWQAAQEALDTPAVGEAIKTVIEEDIGDGAFDLLQKSLSELNASMKVLKNGAETAIASMIEPEKDDAEDQLKLKIEAELGKDAFKSMKMSLKKLGITEITIYRSSKIIL